MRKTKENEVFMEFCYTLLNFQSPDFIEALLKFQGTRLDDQRCFMPMPNQFTKVIHNNTR